MTWFFTGWGQKWCTDLGEDEDVRVVPDPTQVLDVVEEAALLAPLQLSISTNLPRLGIVLQVEPGV